MAHQCIRVFWLYGRIFLAGSDLPSNSNWCSNPAISLLGKHGETTVRDRLALAILWDWRQGDRPGKAWEGYGSGRLPMTGWPLGTLAWPTGAALDSRERRCAARTARDQQCAGCGSSFQESEILNYRRTAQAVGRKTGWEDDQQTLLWIA
jgi:hypothetical protein